MSEATMTDIETIERALDETNYPPGTKLWVDAHAALDRIERVVEAAREAERHLTFNGWKDDPNSDRRFAAVTALREALGALDG